MMTTGKQLYRQVPCPECDGTGWATTQAHASTCPDCHGQGYTYRPVAVVMMNVASGEVATVPGYPFTEVGE